MISRPSLALCDEPTRKNHDACGLGAPSEPSVFPLSVRYNRLSPASPAIQTPQVPPDGGNTHGADPRCLDGISTKLTDNHWKTNLRYCYLDETRELLSWSNSRNTGLHADLVSRLELPVAGRDAISAIRSINSFRQPAKASPNHLKNGQLFKWHHVVVQPSRPRDVGVHQARARYPATFRDIDVALDPPWLQHGGHQSGIAHHEGIVDHLTDGIDGAVPPERPDDGVAGLQRLSGEGFKKRQSLASQLESVAARVDHVGAVLPRRDGELHRRQECVGEAPADVQLLVGVRSEPEGALAIAIPLAHQRDGTAGVGRRRLRIARRRRRLHGLLIVSVAPHHVGENPRVAEHPHLQRGGDEALQPVGGIPVALLVELAHPDRGVLRSVRCPHFARRAEASGEARPSPSECRRPRVERRHELPLARIELEPVDACGLHQQAQPLLEPIESARVGDVEQRAGALPPAHGSRRAVGIPHPVAQLRALGVRERVGVGEWDDPHGDGEVERVKLLDHRRRVWKLARVEDEVAIRATPPVVDLHVRAREAVRGDLLREGLYLRLVDVHLVPCPGAPDGLSDESGRRRVSRPRQALEQREVRRAHVVMRAHLHDEL
mmetsp:Transcript_21750/g.54189  ORF Transcript_21750/g.54189 Transcript_21750/m.54189 type:complete len:606 (+) Transcript_21750:252-2069(+)